MNHRSHFSKYAYKINDKSIHYKDSLVIEYSPSKLTLSGTETYTEIQDRITLLFNGKISRSRIVILKKSLDIIFILLLELQPGVHSINELTLDTLVKKYSRILKFKSPNVFSRNRSYLSFKDEQIINCKKETTLKNEFKCKKIIFHFSKIQVGFGDRIVGLASAMVLAKALDVELFLDAPFMPEIFLTKYDEIANPLEYDIDYLDTQYRYTEILAQSNFNELNTTAHVIGNECFHYALYLNPHFKHRLSDFKTDLREAYKEIFRKILIPKDNLLEKISQTLSLLSYPEKRLVGLQIRSGVIRDEVPCLSMNDLKIYCDKVLEKIATVNSSDLKIFVTADNTAYADSAKNYLKEKGVDALTINDPILHISYPENQESYSACLKLFADFFLLSKSDMLFYPLFSNFGRIGSMMMDSEESYGFYGRHFDLLPLHDFYISSSKHLLYNDSIIRSLGGIFRFRYFNEYTGLKKLKLLANTSVAFVKNVIIDKNKGVKIADIKFARHLVEAMFMSEF
ncbi:hypothetical protein Lgra_1559 [Legionella gratiana]|uniref:Uncharacterized protein n=1 Tax=Legionella gratiana TaxID=45066 RepID=A0A378JFA1_9GAMM|nr:hypothetical protein [Legionella gratiana]KTD12101.1 hypothetical protein Lgra_1559 [Legionella gratiana]STX46295.1 Uncharacterised protein [Legionella gratiana]